VAFDGAKKGKWKSGGHYDLWIVYVQNSVTLSESKRLALSLKLKVILTSSVYYTCTTAVQRYTICVLQLSSFWYRCTTAAQRLLWCALLQYSVY
jgi:hypothetical protein